MTLDATNVLTGVSGEVLVGLTSATYPATAAAATTGFVGLGYLGPDGVLPKSEKSTNDLTAWQNNAVVRTTVTEAKRTFEFTLWETTVDSIEFAYGVTVTQTSTEGSYTIDPSATSGRRKFVIDVVDGVNTRREMFEGELTSMEESGWKNGEPIAFKCTVTVYGESTVKDTKLKTA
jgi:hypothetical protein